MNTENTSLDRSEMANELLGKMPPSTLFKGTLSILFFLISMVILSFVIKYPTVVRGNFTITTKNPPIHLVAKSQGRIVSLYAKDKQFVFAGDSIAIIESTTNVDDIWLLKELLHEPIFIDHNKQHIRKLPDTLKLGILQPIYLSLIQQIDQSNNFQNTNQFREKFSSIGNQINHFEKLGIVLENEQKIFLRNFELQKEGFKRNQILFNSNVISKQDFEIAEAQYLKFKIELESIKKQILNNSVKIEELKNIKLSLFQELADQNYRQIEITQTINLLRNEIRDWENSYVIRSPENGFTSFHKIWTHNQLINLNEELVTIITDTTSQIIGKILFPEQNSGKVVIGNRVILKLDSYPYSEYGVVTAYIKEISKVPSDGFYVADIEISNITTSYGMKLSFNQEMRGTAEIVTEELRLIERFFYQLRSLFRNS